MKSLTDYLDNIDPEQPDEDVVFAFRKEFLSRYKSLEKTFDLHRPEDPELIDLYIDTGLVIDHTNLMAGSVLNGSFRKHSYEVVSGMLPGIESKISRLAKDTSQRNQRYATIARTITEEYGLNNP